MPPVDGPLVHVGRGCVEDLVLVPPELERLAGVEPADPLPEISDLELELGIALVTLSSDTLARTRSK